MLTVYNLISRFIIVLIKIPASFCGYQQADSKVLMERQNTQNRQTIEAEERSLRVNSNQLEDIL